MSDSTVKLVKEQSDEFRLAGININAMLSQLLDLVPDLVFWIELMLNLYDIVPRVGA